jgi:hypothetical protein
MQDGMKHFFYALGIITAVYLFFRYILPLAFKIIMWTFGLFFNILTVVLILLGVAWLVSYFSRSARG